MTEITQPPVTAVTITRPPVTAVTITRPPVTAVTITRPPKLFNKFSRGLLDTLSELGSNVLYNLSRYVDLLESLLSQMLFIPADYLPQVLTVIMNSQNEFINRFHFVLSQDLVFRDSKMPPDDFIYETLYKLIQTLTIHHNHTPSLIVLQYIVGLLDKNKGTCRRSLTRQIHSLQSKILDLVLSTVSEIELPPSLMCLPSLTTTLLTLLSLLANEERALAETISRQLDNLPTTEAKCLLLRSLPSHFLREMVIDIHLTMFFMPIHSYCSPLTTVKDISKRHFRRRPYRPNGLPHDLSFFLSLLCLLVESHLINDNEQNGLSELHLGVQVLTNSLYDDPLWVARLSECDVWFALQLLTVLTAASQHHLSH